MALKFKPAPTFKATVKIPQPGDGAEPIKIGFTFKHRTRSELLAWGDSAPQRDDVESILGCAEGWDLDDPLNRESLTELFEAFHAAPRAIADTYVQQLTQARLGN